MTRKQSAWAAGLAAAAVAVAVWPRPEGEPHPAPVAPAPAAGPPATPAGDLNDDYLSHVTMRVALAEKAGEDAADEWGRLAEDLGRPFPRPDAVAPSQQAVADAARRVAAANHRAAGKRRDGRLAAKTWDEQRPHLAKLMDGLEFAAAAAILVRAAADNPAAEQVKKSFLRDAYVRVDAAFKDLPATRGWAKLTEQLDEAHASTDVLRLIGADHRSDLVSWRAAVAESHDRAMYQDLLQTTTHAAGAARAAAYLREAPVGAMRVEVQAYADWWAAMQRPTEMKFTVKIEWGKWYSSDRTNLRLTVGDRHVINLDIPAVKGGESPDVPSDAVTLVPAARCDV